MTEAVTELVLSSEPFEQRLIALIEQIVGRGDAAPVDPAPAIDRDTPLFEGGLIDSLAIIQLVAFVEQSIGRRITTREVVMRNFRSVGAICDAFAPEQDGVGGANYE